jgi:hypothetical protein
MDKFTFTFLSRHTITREMHSEVLQSVFVGITQTVERLEMTDVGSQQRETVVPDTVNSMRHLLLKQPTA